MTVPIFTIANKSRKANLRPCYTEDLCSTHIRFSDFSVRSYIRIGSGTYPKKNGGYCFCGSEAQIRSWPLRAI